EAVVVWHPVDVVDDQRHPLAPPELALAALLAATLLEALAEEPLLEVPAAVGRVAHEDAGERDRLAPVRGPAARPPEVARVDPTAPRVPLDGRGVPARAAVAEPAQRLRPGERGGDRGLELLASEPRASFHERMFACEPDGNSPYTQPRSGVV